MKPLTAFRVQDAMRYICLFGVILSGLISIIATGGGGGDSRLFPLWVPTDIVVSDIDGNGRNDILTLARLSTSMSHDEGRLSVYLQLDQGGFPAPTTSIVGKYPWQAVVGDMDGDALPDLLVTDPDLQDVRLLLQDPAHLGQFLPSGQIISGIHAYYAVVADFNKDSASDIAIGDSMVDSGRIAMLYQDPGQPGTFLPAVDSLVPGSSSSMLTADDLNGDGLADLLVWVYLEPSGYIPNGILAISLQQQNGTLGPMQTAAPQTGLNVGHLAVSDYNSDGAKDLFVFFTPFSTSYKAKLTVVLQDPDEQGTFAAPVDTLLDGIKGIDDAVVADLNGDGSPDFAVVGFFPEGSPSTVRSRLNVFTQSGGGAFALSEVYEMPIAVSRVASGDIDGDGLIDLVVLGGENQGMVLIQSHTLPGTFNQPTSL